MQMHMPRQGFGHVLIKSAQDLRITFVDLQGPFFKGESQKGTAENYNCKPSKKNSSITTNIFYAALRAHSDCRATPRPQKMIAVYRLPLILAQNDWYIPLGRLVKKDWKWVGRQLGAAPPTWFWSPCRAWVAGRVR